MFLIVIGPVWFLICLWCHDIIFIICSSFWASQCHDRLSPRVVSRIFLIKIWGINAMLSLTGLLQSKKLKYLSNKNSDLCSTQFNFSSIENTILTKKKVKINVLLYIFWTSGRCQNSFISQTYFSINNHWWEENFLLSDRPDLKRGQKISKVWLCWNQDKCSYFKRQQMSFPGCCSSCVFWQHCIFCHTAEVELELLIS